MVEPAMTSDAEKLHLDEEALRRLSGRIAADVGAGRYLGASVLVARGGVIGYQDHIGEVAPGRPVTEGDIYLLMSLSKAFTAALVLRAIDQGRLTLDTRIADVIPAFAVRGKHLVTVRHLLTHSGGTYTGFPPPPPLTMTEDVGDLRKNVQILSGLPLAFTPGSQVVYNPFASYALLGQLLVEIDERKRSFSEIARDELFGPLGMTDTSFGLAVDEPRRVPVSVAGANAAVIDKAMFEILNTTFDERTEHPAGGAFATAVDVFKFADALRRRGSTDEYRLMSPAMFEYACQNHTGSMRNGFWDFDREARNIPEFPAKFSLLGGYVRGTGHHLTPFGQTASPRAFGAVGGGSTLWMVDPDRDLTFVFLSAGFLDGLDHFARLQQVADLVLAAVND
ncbi:serine hydrolase domain-containing protein [Streptomyces sp. Li-HN-5-11]|uniref:serine hydrolase domain-containing protein n=1 Tax=Streptomyces sp. Li-HN-5-11 TaxID=3075432 RepID=UPI0028A84162|nr:serine hydrolase domain-containing protein [Streptomyces sp. Li-HN-5-11]WNM31945.1 serine hydrolase domain-containing protein [Streptomyces sp. Li-HN-5-11]